MALNPNPKSSVALGLKALYNAAKFERRRWCHAPRRLCLACISTPPVFPPVWFPVSLRLNLGGASGERPSPIKGPGQFA